MTAQQKEIWRDFRKSLIWTLIGSFFVSFAFRQTPQWVSTLAFGITMPGAALVIRLFAKKVRFRSFFLTIFLQALMIAAVFSAAFYLAFFLCIVGAGARNPATITNEMLFSSRIGIGMAVAVGIAITLTLIFNISNKLGPGVLLNWMTGKYHDPKEETRFFMFLDIKDSTTLAEQLGNLEFSALVRDFFDDMSNACYETKAEVSHYIGDEAVISWRPDRGKLNGNCVRFFFIVRREIEKRAEYYRTRYGLVPGFKAGLHIGPVVATEVGKAKSEIVFHGDVMNTTARIQGICASLNTDFLISEEARTFLAEESAMFKMDDRGEQTLKGKALPVRVHTVSN